MYKVSKTLDISNLKHKRESKDTYHSTDSMLLLLQNASSYHVPMQIKDIQLEECLQTRYLPNPRVQERSCDPGIESHDPSVKSHDPSVESRDPSVESHDPSVESHDPSVESYDPSVESCEVAHKCLPVLAKHEHPQ